MTKKRTTKKETVVEPVVEPKALAKVPRTPTAKSAVAQATPVSTYGVNDEPVVNTQVVVTKKRIRDRKKAVKKLSTAILCANTGFQRFS